MKCKCCGGTIFIGHQMIRADVLVSGNTGDFYDNLPGGLEPHIYDSEKPYGPFTCNQCGAEYDELSDECLPNNAKETESGWVHDSGFKPATYTSVWDDGIEISTFCMVNPETHEVSQIRQVNVDGLDYLEREYVTVNGVEYDVVEKEEYNEEEMLDIFWRD